MKKSTTKFGMLGIAALVAVLATSTVVLALSQSAVAAPANKTAFGDSELFAIASADPTTAGYVTIVNGAIKTSSPSDLLVRHDQECTIHTGVNLDKDTQKATSAVREDVRLKVYDKDSEGNEINVRYINPAPLGTEGQVTGQDAFATPDTAEESNVAVTMCGRAYEIDTNIIGAIDDLCNWAAVENDGEVCILEEELYFDSFIRTKSAHGWSWVVPNLGSGEHYIEVQAKLFNELSGVEGQTSGKKGPANDSGSSAVDTVLEIGKKSLIITEQKFSSDI